MLAEVVTTRDGPNGKRFDVKRLVAILIGMALVIAACGGDSSTASTEGAPAGDSSQPQSTEGSGASDTPTPPMATVTIGDETFTFSHEGFAASSNCRADDNGTFQALLLLVDQDGDLTVRSDLDLNLLHEGTDSGSRTSNKVFVRLGHLDEESNLDYTPGWSADAASAEQFGYPSGASQVDSYVIDGRTASGTATFVDAESSAAFLRGESDTVESVQGTFTVTCGG